ncbi:MAG: hypothetical protein ACO1NX_08100 [Chitinophagaceae bacterium]
MQTAKRCLFILLSVLCSSALFATKYTFTGNGDWKDQNNWAGGIKPNYQLQAIDTLIINGTCINLPEQIDEYYFEDVFGSSAGTIIISKGASLTLVNYTQFSHEGRMEVYGTLINQTTFEAYVSDTIIIYDGGLLKNERGTGLMRFFGNQGYIELKSGGAIINEWEFDNNMFPDRGLIVLNSGSSIINTGRGTFKTGNIENRGGSIQNSATLSGNAVIDGNLLNTGTISPGNSPGTYGVKGNYTATSSTIHNFEVGGTAAGQYDLLKVEGTANLNGTLNVSIINGFYRGDDHEIPIIQGQIKGTFAIVNIPNTYSVIYNENSVVLKRLPIQTVSFTDFRIEKEDKKGRVLWSVVNEADVLRYEVERSSMAYSYFTISQVTATSAGTYSIIDTYTPKSAYYRIKCIYSNGHVSYSQPVMKYYTANVNTFTGPGNWSDPSKWSNGVVPTTLAAGDYLAINGDCQYDLNTFNNDGFLEILQGSTLNLTKGVFENTGTINIWGTLENNAERFQNLDSINLSGMIINNTTFQNTSFTMGVFNGGTFINNPSGVYTSGSLKMDGNTGFLNYGTIGGNITFGGDFLNESNLSPGNSPGTCTVMGDYTATSSALHNFEIDGFTTGTYDVLHVNGVANLNGVMNITIKEGLPWNSSTSIPIIKGNINGVFIKADLPDGFVIEYNSTSVVVKRATALPVQFVSLKAFAENNQVKLQWEAADEKNVKHYEVQRSNNANGFSTVGKVQAASYMHYTFTDLVPEPKALYRIKSVDDDGKYKYSQVVLVKQENAAPKMNATVTSSGNEIIVQHRIALAEGQIMIHAIDGKLLKKIKVQKDSQQTSVDFSFAKAGIYVISYFDNSGAVESQKVFKR